MVKSIISQIASEGTEHKDDEYSDDESDLESSDDEIRLKRMASEYTEDEQKNKIIQAITDYVFKIEIG